MKKILLHSLLPFSLFCIVLTITSVVILDSIYPAYLIWNLVLAYVPLVLAWYFNASVETKKSRWVQGLLGVLWLIFFPNALYMVTDFVHLYEQFRLPVWFDIAEIFSYTWITFFVGFLSLMLVEKALAKKMILRHAHGLVVAILLVSSIGIYIGRYLRWNSWDIFIQPWNIVSDIVRITSDTSTLISSSGMILVFFGMFLGTYYTFRSILYFNLNNKKL